jgi:serine/threonine-protein kinase
VSYCVYDQEQAQLVTVTILRRAFTVQEEALAQFARQMSGLSSPRISRFLDYSRHRGRHYMLSEYIEGQLLKDRLRAGGPLPYSEAMQFAGQIAEALEVGHRQGALHLDLQPNNIVLGTQGAILVDYGYSRLARLIRSSGRLAQADRSDYQSPEQLAGKEGDEASDIYALGTILYEMLTGHTPGVGSFQPPSEANSR